MFRWLLKLLRREQALESCRVYCPGCSVDLTRLSAEVREDASGLVSYVCPCGVTSLWDFDAPAPILVSPVAGRLRWPG
jgi:hypothetical protein